MTHDKTGNGIVLGAHDGLGRSRDYLEWRFRSEAKGVSCQYFEVWNDAGPQSLLRLGCAYFTVLVLDNASRQYEELLCIHCDPDDDSDVKRGTHLHVTKCYDPIPKCHFPLNYGHLEDVLSSIHKLDEAMGNVIACVAAEVIPRFPTTA